MSRQTPSVCDSCVQRITADSCRAFDSIPLDILSKGSTHDRPREFQRNDVVWEFAPGTEQEFDDWRRLRDLGQVSST